MKRTVFRIVFNSGELVFRDIAIDQKENLEQLHFSIIAAFKLDQNQMGSFYVSNENWEKLEEIPQFPMEQERNTMQDWVIESIKIKDKFLYVYDFLQMYIFYVEAYKEDEGDLPIELLLEKGKVSAQQIEIVRSEEINSIFEEELKNLPDEDVDNSLIDRDIDINNL